MGDFAELVNAFGPTGAVLFYLLWRHWQYTGRRKREQNGQGPVTRAEWQAEQTALRDHRRTLEAIQREQVACAAKMAAHLENIDRKMDR